jgi:integrase/recombinase XerC
MARPTQNAPTARTSEVRALHERAERWASLSSPERRQRAAEAVRGGDAAALWSLTEAHAVTFGKRGTEVSRNTLLAYERGLRVLVAWAAAQGLDLDGLGRQEALRYTRHLETSGLSPASVNQRLAAARAFTQALLWAGLLDGDPFARIAVTDPTPAAEKRHPYSPEELAALLARAAPRERALILLGADGGLRVAEIAALTWQDVGTNVLVVLAESGGKQRSVAITERLSEALGAIRPATRDNSSVFGVTTRRLQAILTALCNRAGIEPKGVHSLRHSAGTRLYAATKDLELVARHLGHATTRPAETYAQLADETYRTGVDALGEASRPATA